MHFEIIFLLVWNVHGYVFFKAAWSDVLAITISNNSPYKPTILLESYILSLIYTSKIGLLSKLKISKVNSSNLVINLSIPFLVELG